MKLLLISNSTNAGEEYLRYPLPEIGRFLQGVSEIVFVPYAAVTFSYAEYEKKKVQARLSELGIRVRSVHRAKDPRAHGTRSGSPVRRGRQHLRAGKKMQEQGLMAAILRKNQGRDSLCRLVGGQQRGMSHHLHHKRHAHRRATVVQGCRSRKVPDKPPLPRRQPRGHAGETREQRILRIHRGQTRGAGSPGCARLHAALRPGTAGLIGKRPMRIFRKASHPTKCSPATTCRSYYKYRYPPAAESERPITDATGLKR